MLSFLFLLVRIDYSIQQLPGPNEYPGRIGSRCGLFQFDCDPKARTPLCIPLVAVRDCTPDCPNMSDEWCGQGMILCDAGLAQKRCGKCVRPQDIPHQCLDRKWQHLCAYQGTFKCAKTMNCVFGKWLMDGKDDCGDGSDEDVCAHGLVSCSRKETTPTNILEPITSTEKPKTPRKPQVKERCGLGEFRCLDGECLDVARVLDGQEDCADASDENYCEMHEGVCNDATRCSFQRDVQAFGCGCHQRYRRQILDEPNQQIDLNITVPYIFSARLYTYGASRGDIPVHSRQEVYKLENPVHFMGRVYDTVYISRDGSVGFSEKRQKPSALPVEEPIIAVFWQPATLGNVWYRETSDVNIVNLAHNEVNIQYRYGSQFRVLSVVLITWEGVKDPQVPESEGNTFQLALIIGDSMTFAHFIYSKLNYNTNAIAGFSTGELSYSLPDSATHDAILLSEKSDIGIPGEWLFRVDKEQIYLCGAGFKGLECIESCAPSQWFNDCSKSCHCDGGDGCDQENGRCPNGKCSPGWTGGPVCDVDLDECEMEIDNCPNEQPDCLNTPGSFLCLCFEYDESRQMCKNSKPAPPSAPIPVDVVPMRPTFTRKLLASTPKPSAQRNRFKSTVAATSPTFSASPSPTSLPASSSSLSSFISSQTFTTPLLTTEIVTRPVTTTTVPPAPSACSRCDQNAKCKAGTCECSEGFTGDGFRCYDVDECQIPEAVCGEHSICSNTIGSFECTCHGGYRFEDGQCADVDECRETPKICGEPNKGTKCVNKDGSFECLCKDGYEGDPSSECRDINECKTSQDACGPNSECTNTEGGYECECLPGFERLAEGAHCTDRDECAVEPCHPAATCSNTRGSYKCECIEGFVGDGKTCHETILYPISNDSTVIPRSWDSATAISLVREIAVFGKKYRNIYLSTNGIISFEGPLRGLIDHADTLKQPAVFALHAQFDYIRDGLVAYTYINDSDPVTLPLLMRSSIGIQTVMGIENFNTKHLHIFTFDRVRQSGSDNLNSFQIVLAQDEKESTILSLIYEKVQARGPISAISTPGRFLILPNNRLTSGSNVGQPGKWVYRVDTPGLQTCPPGRLGEPLCDRECSAGHYGINCESTCHCDGSVACDVITGMCPGALCRAGWEGASCDQDIDECAMSLVTCAHGSECVNTRGGYRCDCKKGFVPVGKECKPVDICLSRFSVPCSRNAECLDAGGSEPKCVCLNGYHGDGFRCATRDNGKMAGGSKLIEDLTHHLMEAAGDGPNNTTEPEVLMTSENPFLMKNWTPDRATETPPTVPRGNAKANFVTVQTPPLLYTAPPIKPALHDKDMNIGDGKPRAEESEGFSAVFIIAPGAFLIIWIVLIFLVLVVCKMNKRKREEHERQHYPAMRDWKVGRVASRETRMITASNPNVIYGRTPRITPYEGY
ncbi:unnamed protein product [Caenorhabditis sp. 36 PRJEB53466]|nr:unnamed protein product [Caenorhabditis sp. 36 PRJEB53466]